jgi:ABC-type sugar transport system substrate-binding protein
MGGLLRAAMAVALVAALAGACANAADTTLHPDPPAVTYAPLEHPFRGARLFWMTRRPAPAGNAGTEPAGWTRSPPGRRRAG